MYLKEIPCINKVTIPYHTIPYKCILIYLSIKCEFKTGFHGKMCIRLSRRTDDSNIEYTSNNQRLGDQCGRGRCIFGYLVNERFGGHREKGFFFCLVEILVHEDTPHAPLAFSSILTLPILLNL